MILVIGAPLSLAGQDWIWRYLKEYGMYMEDFKAIKCHQVFKFGPSRQYVSKKMIELKVVVMSMEGMKN